MDYANYMLPALHRLASGQDENFITEAFAFVMKFLIVNEPAAATLLLNYVTNGFLSTTNKDIQTVDVKTQVSTALGRPDLVLSTDDCLVYIEIKVDASFGDCQLSRYRDQLQMSGASNTMLVAITRYPITKQQKCLPPDHSLRWHHIADFCTDLQIRGEVASYVMSEFLNLISARGLTMNKVRWEMIEGVRSFLALVDMLAEALAAKDIAIRNSAAQEWRGFYIEKKTFFVGMYFSDPGVVVLNSEVALKEKAVKDLKLGKFQDGQWRNELNLTAEETHFFARSRASQIQCLEQFIQESLDYGKTLVQTS